MNLARLAPHQSLICVALGRNSKEPTRQLLCIPFCLADSHRKELLPRELDPTSMYVVYPLSPLLD